MKASGKTIRRAPPEAASGDKVLGLGEASFGIKEHRSGLNDGYPCI